ncbi:MAG: protein BatD [Bacteroidota bacterium]|nr:protein BatD [Bacteroidota bacterium]
MITFLQSGFKKFFFLFLFLTAVFVAKTSYAQVKFSVVCPQKKIGKKDLLQIQFKVENASSVDEINPPSFNNFTVVSGPNQEQSTSNINGKVSGYVSLGYSLAPTSTGTFTIGPATAEADGKQLKTDPVTITVVNGSLAQSQPNTSQQNLPPFPNLNFDFPPEPVTHQFDDYILKPGENVAEKTAKNLFIKLDVNKKSCYVGEPIVATYELYTRLPSETTITDAPSFNGFSVNDLDINSNSALENYNGRKYNVYTIRKVELYPLQAGNITLGSMTASNKITFVKSQYLNKQDNSGFFDMFQNFGSDAIPPGGIVEKNVILKSTPEVITIKPLPTENKPQGFRGAVGDFSISASLEKNNITTDDAGTLKLTITGKGNIQLINAPSINWPNGIDGYDAKITDNVDRKQVPMQGSKTFSYPFTVSKPGTFTIDSIAFSYFDPSSSTYKILRTASLQVNVKKGKGISQNSVTSSPNASKKGGFFSNRTELITGIILVAGILLAILFVLMKRNKDKNDLEKDIKVDDLKNEAETNAAKKEKFVIPENPLTAAHEKLMTQDSAGFYHTLDASLKKYLATKLKVPANELSKKRLNEELDKCNVSLGTSLMLTSLMDDVELNLYAPPSNVNQLNSVFEKASEVVSLLDKQVC